jgi:hypothetical protein
MGDHGFEAWCCGLTLATSRLYYSGAAIFRAYNFIIGAN